MVILSKQEVWIFLVVLGVTLSAPLDREKIYFPGDMLDENLEPRNDGMQSYQQSVQIHPHQNVGEDSRQAIKWDGDRPNEMSYENYNQQHFPLIPPYEGLSTYQTGFKDQIKSAPHYQPAWGLSNPQYAGAGREKMEDVLSNSFTKGSVPQMSSSPDALDDSYIPQTSLQHHHMHSSALNDSSLRGSQKTTQHRWTSLYSSAGAGSLQHQQQKQQNNDFGHTNTDSLDLSQMKFHSGSHATNGQSDDLATILDGPYQNYSLHPNIKKAFTKVIADLGDHSRKPEHLPAHHTLHKISHIRKTTVHNIGKEPTQVKKSSSSDDINLSDLMEQLQRLEQSPRHENITWCEEKIKEFLRALRHKQASGVYINQHIQEETLHQILNQERVENSDQRKEVHEPPMIKMTVKPLGEEEFSQSHKFVGYNGHHHTENTHAAVPEDLVHQQDESLIQEHSEVITVMSQISNGPESLAHLHEQPKEVPPFTSDTRNDLKELELELPEYIPFDHAHSGDEEISQSSEQALPLPSLHEENSETSSGNEAEEFSEDMKIVEDPQRNLDSINNINDGELEVNTLYQDEPKKAMKQMVSEKEKIKGEKRVNQETVHNIEETHHILRRPEASQQGVNNLNITNEGQNMKTMHEEGVQIIQAQEHSKQSNASEQHGYDFGLSTTHLENLQKQQINYDTLIEELIQLESIPGHQAIDKCEEKIQEFLEILKYQQEKGFGKNQEELEKLHQTLIEQAQERSRQLQNSEESTLPPTSFWKKVQKSIKKTYEGARDRAKEVIG